MKIKLNKWIILAYFLVSLAWIVWYPFAPIQSQETAGRVDPVGSDPDHSEMKMDSSSFEGINCTRCHSDKKKMEIDYENPACKECHSAEEEAYPIRPLPIPVALSSQNSPPSNELVLIPEGIFLMGSEGRVTAEGRGNADEQPRHKVYVKNFYIDRHEVTNQQYKAFADNTENRFPRHWNGEDPPDGKKDHPVIYINWFEANDYCHWIGKRLPSEAEWEKAARGTQGLRFPWGNTFDVAKANTPQRSLSLEKKMDTMPVGSFEEGKSPYGIYDMAGNVYEWTMNWYKPHPHNPQPNQHYGEKNKIVKGGSYFDCLSYGCGLSAPTFNRTRFAPIIRNKSFGFRCAKNQSPSEEQV